MPDPKNHQPEPHKRLTEKPTALDENRRPTLARPVANTGLFGGWGPRL